jgi:hypothetical protein
MEFSLIIDESFAELIDSLGDFFQFVKADKGRNYFFNAFYEWFLIGLFLANYPLI